METTTSHQSAFESSLKLGDVVLARWTKNYCHFEAWVKVTKVNLKSFRTELIQPVNSHAQSYTLGQLLIIPRIGGAGFGPGNCVVEGQKEMRRPIIGLAA